MSRDYRRLKLFQLGREPGYLMYLTGEMRSCIVAARNITDARQAAQAEGLDETLKLHSDGKFIDLPFWTSRKKTFCRQISTDYVGSDRLCAHMIAKNLVD